MTLPKVFWSIPCFDKRKEKPLPAYNRLFVLDWSLLSQDQMDEVLSILQPNDRKSRVPSSLDATVVSMHCTSERSDDRMLAYRKYFTESQNSQASEPSLIPYSVTFVNLNREYFEDESGNEISRYSMIQHVTGQSEPILLGDAGSMLRLSLSCPVNVEEWSESSANTIAQFLNVVERICCSRWYKRPPVYTFEFQPGSDTTNFPAEAETTLLEAAYLDD